MSHKAHNLMVLIQVHLYLVAAYSLDFCLVETNHGDSVDSDKLQMQL